MAPSKLWEVFEKIDTDTSRCNCCKSVLKTTKGSTKGYKDYLKRHPGLWTNYLKTMEDSEKEATKKRKAESSNPNLKQPKFAEFQEKKQKYEPNSKIHLSVH